MGSFCPWAADICSPLTCAIVAAECKKQMLDQVQECISCGEDTVGSVSWSPCVSLHLGPVPSARLCRTAVPAFPFLCRSEVTIPKDVQDGSGSGAGWCGLGTVGLDDLECLFQPWWFCSSVRHKSSKIAYNTAPEALEWDEEKFSPGKKKKCICTLSLSTWSFQPGNTIRTSKHLKNRFPFLREDCYLLCVTACCYFPVQWQCAVLQFCTQCQRAMNAEWHFCPEAAGQARPSPLVSTGTLCARAHPERMRKWFIFFGASEGLL